MSLFNGHLNDSVAAHVSNVGNTYHLPSPQRCNPFTLKIVVDFALIVSSKFTSHIVPGHSIAFLLICMRLQLNYYYFCLCRKENSIWNKSRGNHNQCPLVDSVKV